MKVSAAAAAIRDTKPFVSGPLVGVRVHDGLYLIQSYSQTIAAVVRDVGYLVTTQEFTSTTGRHTSMVRNAWAGISRDVTQAELDSAVRGAQRH